MRLLSTANVHFTPLRVTISAAAERHEACLQTQNKFGAVTKLPEIAEFWHQHRNKQTLCFPTTNFKICSWQVRSCVKVEVAVLGSPSPTVLMVSVDVKQH